MRAFVLLTLLVTPSAFASSVSISGTHASKLTLGAEEAARPTGFAALEVRLIDHQLQLLEFDRGSMVGPALSMAIGGAAIVVGIVTAAVGGFALGIMILVGAVVPLVIGIGWLVANIVHNNAIDVAVKQLVDQRAALGAPLVSF